MKEFHICNLSAGFISQDITIAGGCAKNAGLINVLTRKLDTEIIRLPEDPQIIGAIGAALIHMYAGHRS